MTQVGTYYNDLNNSNIPFNNKQQAITAEGFIWIDIALFLPSMLDVNPGKNIILLLKMIQYNL